MLGSLFPDVPMLALTATATRQKKKEIALSLGMHNHVLIESNPDRPNIFFESKKQSDQGKSRIQSILEPLINELKTKWLDFPLTIIYANLVTISECYHIASKMLGPLQYEPHGACPNASNRMFTQFHAEYPEHERERIVTELVAGTSKLRILFVTVAFGIGIDVKNIRRVIHIGVRHTMEEFFQEAGRCGRDGLRASSTVYYNNNDISSRHKISEAMVDYVSSGGCKRDKLLTYFGHCVPRANYVPAHLCCDVHAKSCDCDECFVDATSEMLHRVTCSDDQKRDASSSNSEQVTTQLNSEKKELLRERLIEFRQTLHGSGRTCVGSISLCTGFSMQLLEEIVDNANDFKSIEDLYARLPLFSTDHAVAILEMLEDIRREDS